MGIDIFKISCKISKIKFAEKIFRIDKNIYSIHTIEPTINQISVFVPI